MFGKYISDVIGSDYENWGSSKSVLIHAPMGTGKTHFILKVLLPYVKAQGKTLVYLANRSALQQQVENEVDAEFADAFISCSYQRFPKVKVKPADPFWGYKKETLEERRDRMMFSADYYVLDEAHYFLSDSTFNQSISACFERIKDIKRTHRNSIWIYMTATLPYLNLYLNYSDYAWMPTSFNRPYVSIPYLDNAGCDKTTRSGYWVENHFMSVSSLLEYKETRDDILKANLGTANCYQKQYFINKSKDYDSLSSRHIEEGITKYYKLEPDYTYIDPVYFDRWDEIVAAILAAPENEKWLIFVESKKRGEDLLKQLKNSGCNGVVFITAENKKSHGTEEGAAFQSIVKNEAFQQRVLIATKVLDNGINIKDSALRHLVIDAFDETTFLQMLGRKRRLNAEERLHLYLQNKSEGEMRKKFRNAILEIIIFWYDLLILQNHTTIFLDNRKFFEKLSSFLRKYTEGGQYKRTYQPFIERRELGRDYTPMYQDALIVDEFQPAKYVKRRVTYDYYKMMSMFEKAYNERIDMAKRQGVKSWEEYESIEKDLQQKQFMWLKEQLSWIGLNDLEHSPANPKYWITEQLGQASQTRQELISFLLAHGQQDLLTEVEEEKLKELFRAWIQDVRPKHRYANSKGSISIINQCLKEFRIPCRVETKKRSVKGKQRQWWTVKNLDIQP